MNVPIVIIRRAVVGYTITVDPAPAWADFNRERPSCRAARRYADGLRIVHGWRIRDDAEGEAV